MPVPKSGTIPVSPLLARLRKGLTMLWGASTKELMGRLGHATLAAALRYQHAMAGRDAAIAAALDRLVDAAGRPRLQGHPEGTQPVGE